ncbi:hypothetical protein DID88_001461 [Monilinia fructigena]|uniref:Uncharacterized protein n=1 Tax=Monilinia fructigena TaxID=38457 RepID=A0A395IX54_9HELO|nr:hypothetical protein DID88_001461 [Monilinia fructigena]
MAVADHRTALYDNQMYQPHGIQPNISSQEQWVQQQAQAHLHNHLYTTYSVLQAQENTLRMQLMQQSYVEQAHAQAQAQAQAQAYAQSHGRIQGGGMPIKQQAADRSRTTSFDQGPLTAPVRPEGRIHNLGLEPLLRLLLLQGNASPSHGANGHGVYQPLRQQANGVPIPNFIADETTEHGYESRRTATTPPELSTPKELFSLAQSAPAQHTMTSSNLRALNSHGPLVVNGSSGGFNSSYEAKSAMEGQVPKIKIRTLEDLLDQYLKRLSLGVIISLEEDISGQLTPRDPRSFPNEDSPLVVNGSSANLTPTDGASSHQSVITNGPSAIDSLNGTLRLSPNSRSRLIRNAQNGGMSPLDIAHSHNDILQKESAHLSPVYETHTPSPTIDMKFDNLKLNGSPTSSDKHKVEHSKD